MRICIDATSLLLRSAGVKNYTYYWLRSMLAHGGGLEVSAFPLLSHSLAGLNHMGSILPLAATVPRIAWLQFLNIRGNPAMNWHMRGVDVFHSSNQVRNPPRNRRLTGTLYDLTCLLMPGKHTVANVQAERNFAERTLKPAAGLIAISEHTRRDAVEHLGLDADKIAVIYPGVAGDFFTVTEEQAIAAAGRFGLHKPYVLFVGTIEPRKNIDVLLDAWQDMPAEVLATHDLVVAGPLGWAEPPTVARLKVGETAVRYIGYVPEADLPALTAAAKAFVYPSLYEGFGFPPAQAMAAGVPVLTSAISSLPEVVGDAGVLVDPRSQREIRNGLLRLLSDDALRGELSVKGRERAAKLFNWRRNAELSADFFRSLR